MSVSASSNRPNAPVQPRPASTAAKKPAASGRASSEKAIAPQKPQQNTDSNFAGTKASNQFGSKEASQKGRAKQTKKATTLKKAKTQPKPKPVSQNGGQSGAKPQGASETAAPQRTSAAASGKGGDVQLDVPWYSQFEKGNGFTPGKTACFDAAKAMAKAGGATVLGADQRIQLGQTEDSQGRLNVDPQKAAQGRAYIDRELTAGRPVVVGVSHTDKAYNADKLTDHFVTVTGRGTDEKGRTFYNYNEPGTTQSAKSTGRLYVDDKTGGLYSDSTSMGKRYEVAMVRKNAQDTSIPEAAPTPGQTSPSASSPPPRAPSAARPGQASPAQGPAATGPAPAGNAPAPAPGARPPQAGSTAPAAGASGAMANAVNAGGLLRNGSSGPAVSEMQQRLADQGYKLAVDGKFGPETQSALREFQKAQGIKVDGLFGPQSLAALQSAGGAAPNTAQAPGPAAKKPAPPASPEPGPGQAPAAPGQDAAPARPGQSQAPAALRPDTSQDPAPVRPAQTQGPAGPNGGSPAAPASVSAPSKPAVGGSWQDAGSDIRGALGVKGPSENLDPQQIDKALGLAAERYGVSKELLVHTMKSESGGNQKRDNGAAHGLMQIENVHKDAYKGAVNVGNDTVANIAYAAQRWAAIGKKTDAAFTSQGLTPPTGDTRNALMDFAYNRGDGVLGPIAKRAKQQGIDTNNLGEYFAGKGGTADHVRDRNGNYTMNITPGPGVDKHGQGSILQEVVQNDLRDGHFKQSNRYKDRSGDGVRDHYDIWMQRSGKLLESSRAAAGA